VTLLLLLRAVLETSAGGKNVDDGIVRAASVQRGTREAAEACR